MSYQCPSLNELKALAAALKSTYNGSNSDRKNFITLINNLVEDPVLMASEHAEKILLGAYLFEMEHISNSYHLRSATNSSLYAALEKGLNISKENPVSNERKIIALSAFYNYVQSSAPENIAAQTTWMTKTALQRPLLAVIKSLLGKLQNEIQCIVTAQPFYAPLHENLKNMEEKYAKTAQQGWFFSTGKAHIPHAKFIDLINDYCDKYFPHMEDADSLEPAQRVTEAYMVRVAAAFFVMRALEKECRVARPNSKLYDMLCKALNIDSTKAVDLEGRIDLLKTLDRHIKNMQDNCKDFIDGKDGSGYKNVRTELKNIQGLISQYNTEYYAEVNAPSRIEGSAIMGASIVAQNGMQTALRNMVGEMPTPGGAALDAAAGATGSLLGPVGTVTAVAMSRFVRSYVIPFVTAAIVASAMDSVGTSVGSVAVRTTLLPAKGLKALLNWCLQVEIDKNALLKDRELLEALVSLPDDAFPPASKRKIENTTGVKPRMAI